jgi:hypothetical protein
MLRLIKIGNPKENEKCERTDKIQTKCYEIEPNPNQKDF